MFWQKGGHYLLWKNGRIFFFARQALNQPHSLTGQSSLPCSGWYLLLSATITSLNWDPEGRARATCTSRFHQIPTSFLAGRRLWPRCLLITPPDNGAWYAILMWFCLINLSAFPSIRRMASTS